MLDLAQTFRSLWTIWFLLLFVGIVVWALWPGRTAYFDAMARLPLRDDKSEGA